MTPREQAEYVLRAVGAEGLTLSPAGGGQSNEVWFAGPYDVRISSRPSRGRLLREAAVLAAVPAAVPCAAVVASGQTEAFSWLVQERLPGVPLVRVWPVLSPAERRGAVHQLGAVLRALLGVAAGPAAVDVPVLDAVPAGAPAGLSELVERLQPAAGVSGPLGLIHGDLHFDNLLWHHGAISGLLDWEYAGVAPVDRELHLLLLFCAHPHLFVAEEYEPQAVAHLYREVPGWLREAYPELFAVPHLAERLTLQSIAYDLRQLARYPAVGDVAPWHPLGRLRATVAGRGIASLLES